MLAFSIQRGGIEKFHDTVFNRIQSVAGVATKIASLYVAVVHGGTRLEFECTTFAQTAKQGQQ